MQSNALAALLMLLLIVMVLGIVVGNCVYDRSQHDVSKTTPPPSSTTTTTTTAGECLCVFDVDRTLTGQQEQMEDCPKNHVEDVGDTAPFGTGRLTLSQLAQALEKTFCGECYLASISEGDLTSNEERELLYNVLDKATKEQPLPKNPDAWGSSCDAEGKPLITDCLQKQKAVPNILKYYKSKNVTITDEQVFFFDDMKENIDSFNNTKYNAKQISCEKRDADNGIGVCGATVDEIGTARFSGVSFCEASDEALMV